jgi:hypothetical protein
MSDDNVIWKNYWFPVKIQYKDTEEICICYNNMDIQPSRPFAVLQLNVGENRNE